MGGQPATAREEWRAHWPLVLATAAGFSLQPVSTYATGLFMEPLGEEFGWNRAQISTGLTISATFMVLFGPFVGALIDRWGSRRLAIAGCLLSAICIASFGLANGSFAQWMALWTVFSVVSLTIKPTIWTAAVTGVFQRSRGLALALTMSGVAIAQIAVPPLSYWLIDSYGWRTAYFALGLGWGALVLIPVVLFLFDAHDHQRARAPEDRIDLSTLPGLGVGEAIRSPVLWRIAIASFITMLLGIGVIVHQVPILVEAGVARHDAALLASLAGAAGIVGKLATGWLMDRGDASMIGGLTLALAGLGFLLLLESLGSPFLIVLAMLVIGYSTGAKLHIGAYLTGRYAGVRNFGKIFGVIASFSSFGAGLGPILAGAIHDQSGSYAPLLIMGIVGSVVSGGLILVLGAYPVWQERRIAGVTQSITPPLPPS